MMRGTYYRWTKIAAPEPGTATIYDADILGTETAITAQPGSGTILARVPDRPLDPDEARMIGVRLIEAAVLADHGRQIREP